MTYITTITGKHIDVFNMSEADVDIMDIAHSLSMMCRYNGHVPRFYSVAQHSCLVVRGLLEEGVVKKTTLLEALYHDATETYICDIPSPIKPKFQGYKELENKICRIVAKRLNLPPADAISKPVHVADKRILVTEMRDLRKKDNPGFHEEADWTPYDFHIRPWSSWRSRVTFLRMHEILTNEKVISPTVRTLLSFDPTIHWITKEVKSNKPLPLPS